MENKDKSKSKKTTAKSAETKNQKSKPESKQNKESASDKSKEAGFWDDAKDSVSEGAKIIGDEAKNLRQKIASYSEVIYGKIKDNTQEVIKYGLDLTSEGVNKAQEAAEQLKDDYEVRKLNNKKKEVSTQLGMKFYLSVKNNDNKLPENLMKDKEILSLIKELEEIDKEILSRKEETDKK